MTVGPAPEGAGPASLLVEPVAVGGRSAPSRLVFGPHETNLGQGRALSDRHVAYYSRRAAGGAGVVVTETASVTANDWPYERAPLAAECPPGWRAVARACAPFSTLVLAGIGHAGGQGSSAYSQEAMWAPSPVADVVTREPPAVLDERGIEELVAAFGWAAARAVDAGLAGVEVDAGVWALLRQFQSGLTNQRTDRYGDDRTLFTRSVLGEVRRRVGPSGVVALRLSCDELAPWAGITPEQAAETVAELARSGLVDLLTVVRGGPFSTSAYRPDAHVPAGFNRELCARMRAAAGGAFTLVLQGSVVDPASAEAALAASECDLVEMTRALIADAELLEKVRSGRAKSIRPCIRCNQACRVRDPRNPIVSCVVDPASGYEATERALSVDGGDRDDGGATPAVGRGAGRAVDGGPPVLVVGGGPAGLECARVLAQAGRPVQLMERSPRLGGTLARAAVGYGRDTMAAATDWLASEVGRLGVAVELDTEARAAEVRALRGEGWEVVLATGSRAETDRYPDAAMPVLDALDVLQDPGLIPEGSVAVIDTVGDAVALNLAEWLATTHGRSVTLICPDLVAGTQLSRTGDLADGNGRLQRAGVRRQLRSLVRRIGAEALDVEDCWTAAPTTVAAAAVVDCGHRLAEEALYLQLEDPGIVRVGDCVAPRTLLEAVLEGRRAALSLLDVAPGLDLTGCP